MSQTRITANANNNINSVSNHLTDDEIGSWRIVKLKNHGTIKVRIGWKNLKQSEYTEEGPYLISGKHIKDGKIQWDNCDHISMERYNESPEIALMENDIIFSKDGTLGNPSIIKNLNEKATINATMMLIRLDKEIHPDYFYQILQSDYFNRFLNNHATKSGIDHILVNDFENFEFPLPLLSEQERIIQVLEAFDKKIDFIGITSNLLQSYKRYLFSVLYPDKSKQSSITHDNKKGMWCYKSLKDIGVITTGSTPKGRKEEVFDEDGMLWVTANDLGKNKYVTDTKRKINRDLLKKSKVMPPGSVFVSCIGIIGKIAINRSLATCNQQINVITPYDGYDSEYLYYTLQRYNRLLNSHASQSVTLLLNKSEFSSIKIPVTDMASQKRIVKMLSMVDKKLDLLKRKRELTRNYKQMVFNSLVSSPE
ncbi:MAG: hypothetical protein BZ133_02185 [Methanosphaera sp. SHI613]|nr:MAG: hypothetical protein BZ133_02185 [Methanosphaera sp. SHI613]